MLLAESGEARVLGQKAPARVDGAAAGLDGGLDQGLGAQVALAGRGRADADDLVEDLGPGGPAVGGRGHADRGDPELAGGPSDAHGDLAPVGDEQTAKHGSWRCGEESGRVPRARGYWRGGPACHPDGAPPAGNRPGIFE